MKKFLLALTAILCVTILNAQRVTKDYRFSNITGIKASSIYNIKLSKGNSDVVKITADERFFKNIKIYKEDNTLVLEWDGSFKHRGNDTRNTEGINVVMQVNSLEELDLSGAASLDGNGDTYPSREFECELSGAASAKNFNVNTHETDLDLSGAGSVAFGGNYGKLGGEISGAGKAVLNGSATDVELEVSGAGSLILNNCTARMVDLELSGAGNVILKGSTDRLKAIVSGAATLKAKELKAMDVICYTSGASGASVYCTGTLETKTTTASKITYYGNPRNIISHNQSLVKGRD